MLSLVYEIPSGTGTWDTLLNRASGALWRHWRFHVADKKNPGDPKKPLQEESIVARLKSGSGETPAGLTSYVGLLGRSSKEGCWLLYPTLDMDTSLELQESDIVHSEPLPPEQSPFGGLGGTRVFVRKGAQVTTTRTISHTHQAGAGDEFDLDIRVGQRSSGFGLRATCVTEGNESCGPGQTLGCPGSIQGSCASCDVTCGRTCECGPSAGPTCAVTCGSTCRGETCDTCSTRCGTCFVTFCGTCETQCGTCRTNCGTCFTNCGTCARTCSNTCGGTCGPGCNETRLCPLTEVC